MEKDRLARLLDDVIALADNRFASEADAAKRDFYSLIATNFRAYLGRLDAGLLLAEAARGYGLGAGRALSDFGLDDHEMWERVGRAERYFRDGK
jgi:hypothetical protein